VTRHSWTKLKLHNYLCRKCGTGKRNARRENGEWFATYHRANGEAVESIHVPPCETGPLTAKRLEWLRVRSEPQGVV
jgi:hypothetical protein